MMSYPPSKKTRRLLLTILVCGIWLLLWSSDLSPSQGYSFRTDFDVWFRGYSAKYLHGYLPDDDWKWLKAQCLQESGPTLDPEAQSWAGATGVCQIIKGAAIDAGLNPRHRTNPRKNIQAAAWLMRRSLRTWYLDRTRFERLQLAWACYNAGCGWIIKAQRSCNDARLWAGISPCLHLHTGDHAKETLGYVRLIPIWYSRLTTQGGNDGTR